MRYRLKWSLRSIERQNNKDYLFNTNSSFNDMVIDFVLYESIEQGF